MDAAALAALAGNVLVTAAVTDAWEGFRHKVARLFGRGQPDPAIGRRLDETARQLAAADPAGVQSLRETLARQWEVRFTDLLADHPDAAGELAGIVSEVQASTATAAGHALAARDVEMKADRGGVNIGVMHGDFAQGPIRPDPASI
jgi:hypothetical protein